MQREWISTFFTSNEWNLVGIGPDWLCYLVVESKMATIFFYYFFFLDQDHLLEMKTVEIHALAFLAHIILNLAGVISHIRTRLF